MLFPAGLGLSRTLPLCICCGLVVSQQLPAVGPQHPPPSHSHWILAVPAHLPPAISALLRSEQGVLLSPAGEHHHVREGGVAFARGKHREGHESIPLSAPPRPGLSLAASGGRKLRLPSGATGAVASAGACLGAGGRTCGGCFLVCLVLVLLGSARHSQQRGKAQAQEVVGFLTSLGRCLHSCLGFLGSQTSFTPTTPVRLIIRRCMFLRTNRTIGVPTLRGSFI